MGTLPEGAVAGISTFTCITPATNPGAVPAYSTGAATPPIEAVTVADNGIADAGTEPSWTPEANAPPPRPV